MSDWHGWKKGEVSLHVGMLPGRKRPCLYLMQSNEFMARISPLATFASEAAGRDALTALDILMGSDTQT